MKEFVVDDDSAATPIGEVIRQAVQVGELVLLDADRKPIAWLRSAGAGELPPLTADELAEIRRRSETDRSTFITTEELLKRLETRAAEA